MNLNLAAEKFSKVRATYLEELILKARYADVDFIDDVVALSIISALLALGAKPMLQRRKRQKEANMLAIHDRIRLRYHTLKFRALIWVLRRQRAVDYRSTGN